MRKIEKSNCMVGPNNSICWLPGATLQLNGSVNHCALSTLSTNLINQSLHDSLPREDMTLGTGMHLLSTPQRWDNKPLLKDLDCPSLCPAQCTIKALKEKLGWNYEYIVQEMQPVNNKTDCVSERQINQISLYHPQRWFQEWSLASLSHKS